MQRLALAFTALLVATAATGCTLFKKDSTTSDPYEVRSGPGFKADDPARGNFEVIIVDNRYSPRESWVNENTTVAFTNGATGTHSAIGDHDQFNTGGVTPQSSVPVYFDHKGDYTYRCGYHTQMQGVIHVV